MDIDAVKRRDAARTAAMLNADADALAALLDDGLVWIHGSGNVDTRDSLVSAIRTGDLKCHRLDQSEVTIRSLGDTAVITGILAMRVSGPGGEREARNRFGAVWHDTTEGPALAYWQTTRLP